MPVSRSSIAALLIAAGALAGCAPTVAEPLSEIYVSSETWVVISDEGAGSVRPGTPYVEATLAGVAPGADIRPIEAAREESTTWTHAAFIDDIQAVQFFKGRGNTVSEMHGVGQNLAGPNGERIGMTMAQARVSRRDCRAGRELWLGMAVCRARGSRHVELVFAIPGYDGPFDTLPSAEDLKEARLQRIVWKAET